MTEETRKGLDLVYSLCDMMQDIGFGPRMGIYQPPRQMLALDLFDFICLIAGADNKTSWDEVAILNEILKDNKVQQLNPQEFANEIKKVYAEGYTVGIPVSLELFVSFDLNAQAEKKFMGIPGNVSDILIDTYTMIGVELVAADGEVTTMEKDMMNGYISKLKRYAMAELSKANNTPAGGGTSFIGGKR